ncbi:citryl-CoA lyase [Candidatus Micrarchaeota archaeon]|nr:citryl-CoA lyase [Candidatus Micrarchaeota archaeon]
MAEWNTKISVHKDGKSIIRGYELEELVGKISFASMVSLLLKSSLPTPGEEKVINAILVSSAEHRLNVSSIVAARSIASTGNSLNASIAGGVLALGELHGGAIEGLARILQENTEEASEIVSSYKANKKRIPGFGHKVYSTDPRTQKLFEIAKSEGVFGKNCEKALKIESELEKQSGKKLCLNVDGAIAALITDMGFSWRTANAFFIVPRTLGISAHVVEEFESGKPVRVLREEEVEYSGELNKKL